MSKYQDKMTKIVRSIKKAPDSFKLSHPSKISLRDRCAFSVPAGPKFACPGATKACAGCYAQKGRHIFTNVQAAMAHNWALLRKFERYNQTDQAVEAILAQLRSDLKIFRIYESGDFHSQWVVEVWAKVVAARPDISFWAYTRSFHLKFASLTRNPNFMLLASTDEFNSGQARTFVNRFSDGRVKYAFGPWDHETPIPDNSFICPATNGKMQLNGACERCKLCIVKGRTTKDVVFLAH